MRTDLEKTPANKTELAQLGRRTHDEEQGGASLSGFERNHLFLSSRGAQFADISGVSGLDDPADGRAFGILDYDRDGWQDIALVNANAPMLELFRNRIGCHPAMTARPSAGRMIALCFVGGNHASGPTRSASARDGFGARVTVDLGDRSLLREHRAGEGFATQNSATLIVGVGGRDVVPAVSVRWPAGATQTATGVPAGTLLTVYENPAQSPTGEAFVRDPYMKRSGSASAAAAVPPRSARWPFPLPRPASGQPASGQPAPRLRVYTTMAAWCTACRSELPQYQRLRATFTPAEVAMFGVPIDPGEGREKIEAWEAAHHPAYAIMTGLTEEQVSAVKGLVLDILKFDAVPATFITDEGGSVIHAQWGPPTISKIRELLTGAGREPGSRDDASRGCASAVPATAPARAR